jgi:hypothetical protein
MADDFEAWISFLQSNAMDNVRAYESAGRTFKNSFDDDLRYLWIGAIGMLTNGSNQSMFQMARDIASELLLRGLDLPLDMLNDKRFMLTRMKTLGLAEWLRALKPEIEEFVRNVNEAKAKN